MNELFNDFISEFVQEQSRFLEEFDDVGFGETVFGFETILAAKSTTISSILSSLYLTFRLVAISLIIYVALKKLFTTYILEKGDADESPLSVLKNAFLALVVAISSTEIISIYNKFSLTLCSKTIEAFGGTSGFSFGVIGGWVLWWLVYLVCWLILQWQSIKRGCEVLILNVGLPISACGLLNGDNGLFAQFIKKYLSITFTTVVQIALMEIAKLLFTNSFHPLWTIAIFSAAISGPKIINDLLAPIGGGGGGMYKVQSSLMIANSIKGLLPKK